MTTTDQPTYITFLLRLWRADATAPWRASLHDPHSGDKHNFASIAQMVEFLYAQAGEVRLQAGNETSGEPAAGQMS